MATSTAAAPSVPPLPGATPLQAIDRFLRHAFRLRGRASRSEYWWWALANVVVLALLQLVLPAALGGRPLQLLEIGPFGSGLFADLSLWQWRAGGDAGSVAAAVPLWLSSAWIILTIIPGVTIAVRRLHDSGLAGWWALLAVVAPGQFVLLLLLARRSRPRGVRFDA